MTKKYLPLILILSAFLFVIIYAGYAYNPPNQKMLKNTKYTIANISSDFYYNKGSGNGYDYKFKYERGFVQSHINGNFVFGRKYLIAYDSTTIKNGYVLLDKFDVTDSIAKYHIESVPGGYLEGWSLEKIPFQYDKSDIEYDVRMSVVGSQ